MADDVSLNSFRTSIVEHPSQCSEVMCGFSSERSEYLPLYIHEMSYLYIFYVAVAERKCQLRTID